MKKYFKSEDFEKRYDEKVENCDFINDLEEKVLSCFIDNDNMTIIDIIEVFEYETNEILDEIEVEEMLERNINKDLIYAVDFNENL